MRNKREALNRRQQTKTTSTISFLLFAFCFLLLNCSRNNDTDKSSSPKFTQYYNQGEQLYLQNCSNCHQKDGKGLGRLYPPLNSSDYLKNNFEDVLCLMRYGKEGELVVNGVSFNKSMPGIPALTDLEIAEIATYLYNSWGEERGLIEVKTASKVLTNCANAN